MGSIRIECLERKISVRKLAKATYKELKQVANFNVDLVFMDEENMKNLNRTSRGVDKVTDVLSFPSMDGIRGVILKPEDCITELENNRIFIGSIVLCEEKIRQQAEEYGHSELVERDYLIVHGLLHLFGYDHMTDEDKKEMRAIEKRIVKVVHPEIEE